MRLVHTSYIENWNEDENQPTYRSQRYLYVHVSDDDLPTLLMFADDPASKTTITLSKDDGEDSWDVHITKTTATPINHNDEIQDEDTP